MPLKTTLKRLIGRALPIDLLEKLTEYSIDQRAESVSPRNAKLMQPTGKTWDELYSLGRIPLWQELLKQAGPDILLLEFGVWKGISIRKFAELSPSPNSRFYGFDSFEGLPEVWRGTPAGYWSLDGVLPHIPDERVKLVKGWFRDTLPPMLDELKREAEGRAVIVHYDADLYSSTLYVLFMLSRIFERYYFVFDEYSGHEARALYNFMQATGAEAEFLHQMEFEGCAAVVTGELRIPAPAA